MKLFYKEMQIKHLINENIKNPKFQRGEVWKISQRQFLIETILLEFIIPPLVLKKKIDTDKAETFWLVDGQQRFSSIVKFTNGEFNMKWSSSSISKFSKDEKYRKVIENTNGKYFSEFPEREKNIFNNFSVYYMLFDVDESEIEREIFSRINVISKTLNRQELRKAKYFSSNMLDAYDVASGLIKNLLNKNVLTQSQIERAIDVELLLSFYYIEIHGNNKNKYIFDIKPNTIDELSKELLEEVDNFSYDISKVSSLIIKTLNILPNERTKISGRYYFEIIYILFNKLNNSKEDIISFLDWICKEENEEERINFQPIHTKSSKSKENSIFIFEKWLKNKND